MAVTTDDLHGDSDRPQPATPGSYGIPPPGFRLPEQARPGPVRLQVADLERSLDYYRGVLGLRLAANDGPRALLAPHGDERVLVELHEHPGAASAKRRAHLGLFHFAILLPDRLSLGCFVRHLSEVGERAGAGDHLVSEAFYLTDPDGLGIEVYADRPRETWMRIGRELMMATDPVDVAGLVRAAEDVPWRGMPAGTVMGHVHLHVGDIALADAFYRGGLGLDVMTRRYPGALFLGAGGYHHHLGANTWAGPTATSPGPDEAQLLAWTMTVPEAATIAALAAHMTANGYTSSSSPDGALVARDPWGTMVEVSSVV